MLIETFKARSARKLISLGQRILAETDAPRLKRRPTGDETRTLLALAEIGPQTCACVWAGQTMMATGLYGEFHLPRPDYQKFVEAGFLTRGGALTQLVRDYLRDPDAAVTASDLTQ